MTLNRNTLLILVAAFLFGMWLGQPARKPQPLEDRPVLRWIIKAAKTCLWVAVFLEEPHPEQPDELRAVVGEDGYVVVDHGRGW
jgi:hypothetical protein